VILKALKITDLNTTIVKFPFNGDYYFDESYVKVGNGEAVEVTDCENIFSVTKTNIITGYSNGKEKITVDEYKRLRKDLPTRDEDGYFDSIEDEYKVKDFLDKWKENKKTEITKTGPIPVDITETLYNIDNKFIKPLWKSNLENASLCSYDSFNARVELLKKICNDLNLEYEGGTTHSGIKFVKIKDKYVFTNETRFDSSNVIIGTLEDSKKAYKKDKETIERSVRLAIGKMNDNTILSFDESTKILRELKNISLYITKVQPKKKSEDSYVAARNAIRKTVEELENAIVNSTFD